MQTKFITAYSPKKRVQIEMIEPSRTKQQFKDECDINNIIARYLKTGVLNFTARNEPRYGDCTGIEFQSAMQTVSAAQSLFNELPARLRDRFGNDPARFLDFVSAESNRKEAEALGLLKPKAASESAAATPPANASAAPSTEAGKQT